MIRIGHGYDVHRFSAGRRLVLGGVEIPSEEGLLGHSDADVLCHALTDALFGAVCLPDIGRHFPDSDPAYAGADSTKLLKAAYAEVLSMGYALVNADCTIIAEKPKLAPYIQQMRGILAQAMGTELDRVSVKATTEEKLGFTGEGLGIAAHAVALIE